MVRQNTFHLLMLLIAASNAQHEIQFTSAESALADEDDFKTTKTVTIHAKSSSPFFFQWYSYKRGENELSEGGMYAVQSDSRYSTTSECELIGTEYSCSTTLSSADEQPIDNRFVLKAGEEEGPVSQYIETEISYHLYRYDTLPIQNNGGGHFSLDVRPILKQKLVRVPPSIAHASPGEELSFLVEAVTMSSSPYVMWLIMGPVSETIWRTRTLAEWIDGTFYVPSKDVTVSVKRLEGERLYKVKSEMVIPGFHSREHTGFLTCHIFDNFVTLTTEPLVLPAGYNSLAPPGQSRLYTINDMTEDTPADGTVRVLEGDNALVSCVLSADDAEELSFSYELSDGLPPGATVITRSFPDIGVVHSQLVVDNFSSSHEGMYACFGKTRTGNVHNNFRIELIENVDVTLEVTSWMDQMLVVKCEADGQVHLSLRENTVPIPDDETVYTQTTSQTADHTTITLEVHDAKEQWRYNTYGCSAKNSGILVGESSLHLYDYQEPEVYVNIRTWNENQMCLNFNTVGKPNNNVKIYWSHDGKPEVEITSGSDGDISISTEQLYWALQYQVCLRKPALFLVNDSISCEVTSVMGSARAEKTLTQHIYWVYVEN